MTIRGLGPAAAAATLGLLVLNIGCNRPKQAEPERQVHAKAAAEPTPTPAADKRAVAEADPKSTTTGAPDIGNPAPPISLKDLDGNSVTLAQFAGKTVVLEWFNPGCPFVKRSHTVGSLVDTAAKHTKAGVVWLAINSGAEGKQGADVSDNVAGKQAYGLEHPILLDPTGVVGKAYGATNTPHMFVIDPEGKLVYKGAIDNSPDGEGQSPKGGTLINYVDRALQELAAGKAVSIPETEAYGCSVKYGDN